MDTLARGNQWRRWLSTEREYVSEIVCFLVLILLASLLLGGCGLKKVTSQSSPGKPTLPATQPATDIASLIAGQAPSYRGITPGTSDKDDVLERWGEPNVIRKHQAFESLHYFSDDGIEFFLLDNDVVLAVTSSVRQNWLSQDSDAATAEDLYKALGTPVMITPTLGYRIEVFPRYGLAIPESFVSFTYQLFEPMSLQDYQKIWGRFPLDYDPFPLIPSVEKVGIRPGETTREQVLKLLGPPDKIVSEDPRIPWIYYVEPDMLAELDIFFNADDIINSMAITPMYLPPRALRLVDAVSQYGEPDAIQLIPGEDGRKYATLGLLYLEQGLRVATSCITPACDTVKRDAVVTQKWYFPPTTLAEFQATFSNPDAVYIEWPGFDE